MNVRIEEPNVLRLIPETREDRVFLEDAVSVPGMSFEETGESVPTATNVMRTPQGQISALLLTMRRNGR